MVIDPRLQIMVAVASFAFARACACADDSIPKPQPYFNRNGDLESVFQIMRPPLGKVPGFDGAAAMEFRYVPSAPASAPGPLQPAITAASLRPGTRWLQIVTIDIKSPKKDGAGSRLLDHDRPWTFTDTYRQKRLDGDPFYPPTADGRFIDNPGYWGDDMPVARRDWQAHLFLVRVQDNIVTPLAGLEWGFGFDNFGALNPKPLRALTREDWAKYQTALAKEYPKWSFTEAR